MISAGRIITLIYLIGYGAAIALATLWPSCVRLVGVSEHYRLRSSTQILIIVCTSILPFLLVEVLKYILTPSIEQAATKQEKLASRKTLPTVIVLFASLGMMSMMGAQAIDYGIGSILKRPFYISSHGQYSTLGVFRSIMVVVPLISGYLFTACRDKNWRWFAILPLAMFAFLQFSYASRQIPLGFILFFASYYRGSGRVPGIFAIVSIIAVTLFSYNLCLHNRALSHHGFIPYLGNMGNGFGDLSALAMTITDSVSVLDATIGKYKPISGDYLISLHPLPGKLVGWAELAPTMRIHRYVPYCTMGELAAGGLGFVFAYYSFVAIAVGTAETVLTRLLRNDNSVAHLCLRVFCLAFAVFSLQYNLRSSTRMVYYALILSGLAALIEYAWRSHPVEIVFSRKPSGEQRQGVRLR